jgi:energy-coupling factor transporter ATP-binding protein EcfA2
MKLVIKVANITVNMTFLGQAIRAVPLCREYFRGFLCPAEIADAEIKVSILKSGNGFSPADARTGESNFEQQLNKREVFASLSESPEYQEDFPENEATIASSCLDGLLLFDPDTAAGRIYLSNEGPECFRPLHRLLWMYLAQVLGERKACFIHSAALVKDRIGYLFLGDSGAGKSTLSRIAEGAVVLSDDSPILSRQNGDYRVFSSPYHQMNPSKGLSKEAIRRSARVEGLFFLFKDERLYLEGVSREEAVSRILKRYILFFPYLSGRAKSALFDLVLELCHRLTIHNLHFCLDQDVWGLITSPHAGGKNEQFRKRGKRITKGLRTTETL